MHHTEDITITIDGLKGHPLNFVVPENLGRDVREYIEARQGDLIPAEDVLPELADDVMRPAVVLRGMRNREGLTQVELAKKLDIRQHHLSEMENGKRPIGKEMAKKLASVLRADWKVFL